MMRVTDTVMVTRYAGPIQADGSSRVRWTITDQHGDFAGGLTRQDMIELRDWITEELTAGKYHYE